MAGEGRDTATHHPIIISSIAFPVLERVIRNEIISHLKLQQFTDAAQHGFFNGLSCLTNLPSAVSMINKADDECSDVDFGFLDFI